MEYYTYTCYKEQQEILENDPNYARYNMYNNLLQIVFSESKNSGIILPSFNKFKELVAAKHRYPDKNLREFLVTCNHLGIMKTHGKYRETIKSYDNASLLLKKYLGFNDEN